ncbi:MAG: hypothetical protein M1821_003500 [Bathelium mastoideum]|nr:MAG: hypothetical protein M1821_003500 [Bathelium mastoideum]
MAGLMTFWDNVLMKCAGKGPYEQYQTRMIKADMRDIETPSNPERPSIRFVLGGDETPESAISPIGSDTASFDGLWEPKLEGDEVPHARVQRILKERLERPNRIPEPCAAADYPGWTSLTAADIVSAPFDPAHRKDSIQSMASKCSQTTFNSSKPFFIPAGPANSTHAYCLPGPIGEEARAKKREKEKANQIDPDLFAELKNWLKKEYPTFELPELPLANRNVLMEGASEEAFLRRRARELARKPMREFVDENGTSVQVGFDSPPKDHLRPLTKREAYDMRNLSSCVRRISVEGLDSLEPIDETEELPTPPSTVPSHMKREQARRQLKRSGYAQRQRPNNQKRSQSSNAIMSRKNNRAAHGTAAQGTGNQVTENQDTTTRRAKPQPRITLADTREEAENAIESDEEEEECSNAPPSKTATPTTAIEDDGDEEFTDVEDESEEEKAKPAAANKLTADRLMAGEFTPEGRTRHERETKVEERRSKSRASQRTLVERHPKVVSNKDTVAVSVHYKPTMIINGQGLVEAFKA